MNSGRLVWVGIACCMGVLLLNMTPDIAANAGVDLKGARPVFLFGLFLVVAGLVAGDRSPPNGANKDQ